MNIKDNKRSKYYESKLKEAMIKLLDSNLKVSQISVTKICEEANVTRSTFYAHFSIPEDIIKEIENELLSKFAKLVFIANRKGTDIIINFLKEVKANSKLYKVFLLNLENSSFQNKIIQKFYLAFDYLKKQYINTSNHELIIHYIIGGNINILRYWVGTNFKKSEQEIADLIIRVSKSTIATFIDQKRKIVFNAD